MDLFRNGLGEPTFWYVLLAVVSFVLVTLLAWLDQQAARAQRRARSLHPVTVSSVPHPFPDDDQDVASVTPRSP